MSELTLADVIGARPAIDPGTPFAPVLEHLADAVVSLLQVVGTTVESPEAFLAEFGERTEEEQTRFGAQIAAGLITIRAATANIAAGVGDAFGAEL